MTQVTWRCMPGVLLVLVIIVGVNWQLPAAHAITYYVDPQLGHDGNAGTSQSSPWRTIPGTRTQDNRAWQRTAWGDRTPRNKIRPGDIIELKAGGVMHAALGGRLVIDATFYDNGTADAPIVIRVSSSWGSGNFVYNMAGMKAQQYEGMLAIASRDYIHIRGASDARRFVVMNAPGDWAVLLSGSRTRHQKGGVFEYIEVKQARKGGLNISYADSWLVANTMAHDNGTVGFAVGGINDEHAHDGTFRDAEAYNNGARDDGSGIRHGFGLYGATSITYMRCKAHNNGRDGFDFGTASNTNNSGATVVDSEAYDNGEDGFATNGGSGTNTTTYINSVAYNNGQAGWHIYGGTTAFLYHTIAHHNGNQQFFGGNYMIYSEHWPTTAVIRNSIGYKPKAYANVYSYNSGGLVTRIDSDYNIFVPRSSNAEVMSETPYGTPHFYTKPPAWIGPHDKVGIEYAPHFVQISTSSFVQNNYHFASTRSVTIGAGIALPGIPYITKDRDGRDRTPPVDIGLYEFSSTAPPPSSAEVVLPSPTNLCISGISDD